MSEYAHARVALDPLGIVELGDGRRRQDIELVLTNDPDRDPPSLLDPVCVMDGTQARQLAWRLLRLAKDADPQPRAANRSGR
jgi:hypothetical protein